MKQHNTIQKHMQTLQTVVVSVPLFKVDIDTKIRKSSDIHECKKCKKYHEWKTKRACKKTCYIEEKFKGINSDLNPSSVHKIRKIYISEQSQR